MLAMETRGWNLKMAFEYMEKARKRNVVNNDTFRTQLLQFELSKFQGNSVEWVGAVDARGNKSVRRNTRRHERK